MDKVVITGGAGFIGSSLAHRLVDLGYYVVIFDNLVRGKYEYVRDLVESSKAAFVEGDIRNYPVVYDAMRGAKYTFHEAAMCINYSLAYPEESILVNVNGSYNVFKAAYERRVKKLVFASSASVYGEPTYLPMDEKHPLNPISPYCVSKIAGEYYLKIFGLKGLKYNILRYFNVYGVRQNVDAFYTSVIMNFIEKIKNNNPPIIHGDGSQSMDFVNVKDVAAANILALEKDVEGEIFNVGCGKSTSVKELAETMIKLFNKDLKPVYQRSVNTMVSKRRADVSKIRKMLGFKPAILLKGGLKEIIDSTT